MWQLIKNENIKMVKKTRTTITFIILLAIILLINFAYYSELKNNNTQKMIKNSERYLEQLNKDKSKNDITMEKSQKIESDIKVIERKINILKLEELDNNLDWKDRIKRDLARLENEKIEAISSNNSLLEENINGSIKLDKYRLEKGIEPKKICANNLLVSSGSLLNIYILAFVIVILVSDIVSGEYSFKTIKMLLVRPHSRSKILFSKFISSSIVTTLVIVGAEILSYLISGLTIGFGSLNMPMIVGTKYTFDQVKFNAVGEGTSAIINSSYVIPFWIYVLIALFIQILFIMACLSVCFLISTLCESNIASFIINIVLVMAFTLFSVVSFSGHRLPIISKILPYTFIFYSDGYLLISGMQSKLSTNSFVSTYFGVVILLMWIIVCNLISNYIFKEKDVLA